MTLSRAAVSLARASWLEHYNRGFRYSKAKAGLWLILSQAAMFALALWRLQPPTGQVPLAVPLVAVSAQVLLFSFFGGLLRGREQLYGKSNRRLIHISPAPGQSALIGLTLGALPQQVVTSLGLAAVTTVLLPDASPWLMVPLLFALAMAAGLLGHLAALLTLVAWVRMAPRSLSLIWGLSLALTVGMAYWMIFLVATGASLEGLVQGLQQAAPWVIGVLTLLVGAPGVVMGLWLLVAPGASGNWYRDAYLALQELGDDRSRERTSSWPAILRGPAGALQARQWREIWRNWFTWARLAFLAVGLASLWWFEDWLSDLALRQPVVIVVGFGLGAALFAFGELLGAVGASDGPNIGLSMVAGVRPGQIVRAKLVSALPYAAICAGATWVVGAVVGLGDWSFPFAAGLIGLGAAAVAVGAGIMDLSPLELPEEREIPEAMRAMIDQVSLKPWGLVGTVAAIALTGGAVWLCSVANPLWVSSSAAALGLVGLVPGYIHLRHWVLSKEG